MVVAYVDTSAAMKLLFDEPESGAALTFLTEPADRSLVASWLLHAELHCAAGRRGRVDPADLGRVLGAIGLVDITRGDLIAAGTHAPLRSNDAIHLAVAVRLGADELITYDGELGEAASRAGLRVISPGV